MRNPEKWSGPTGVSNLIITSMDVTSDESVQACVNLIEKTEGRGVDIVINNAGKKCEIFLKL
jgi:NAD(P)-dependent dehydrogenase (short-subunit alcohol dehydrogenase family)